MEQKPSKFYTSHEISTSFKIFISIFVALGLLILGYFLLQQGESLRKIITLLFAVVGAVALFLIGGAKAFKRIQNLSNLSPAEKAYADDLSKFKLIVAIFKDLPSGTLAAANFLVILGYILKWMLFWIFAGSSIMLLALLGVTSTLLDLLIMLCLATTWCPWLENLLLKKINYKLIFCSKIIATILIFAVAISVTS